MRATVPNHASHNDLFLLEIRQDPTQLLPSLLGPSLLPRDAAELHRAFSLREHGRGRDGGVDRRKNSLADELREMSVGVQGLDNLDYGHACGEQLKSKSRK